MLNKIDELRASKERLIDELRTHTSMNTADMKTKEIADVADAIKDLAEAERNCWEACYYQLVCEAMSEGSNDRAGYDNWRFASGRFAPTGHGHRSGYPDSRMDPAIHRMGYHEGNRDMNETIMSIKETMRTADPEMKRKLKTDLANLLGEMN